MKGVKIKEFKVPQPFLKDLRQSAVPQSMATEFPGRPFIVDPTKAPNQFGLRAEQIERLREAVLRGSYKERP